MDRRSDPPVVGVSRSVFDTPLPRAPIIRRDVRSGNWIAPPATPPPPPVTSRAALSRSSSPVGSRQQTVAGDGSVVPVIYGADRYGGQFAGAQIRGESALRRIILLVVWCRGPISGVSSVRMYDEPLPSSVTATHYTGAAGQGIDPTMAAACLANGITYTDTLPGKAYSVFSVPQNVSNGFPTFSAKITGQKVALTSGGTLTWSDNPAYHVADFVESTVYGMGQTIDWASVATVAARCAELIGSPAEKRRTLNLTIDRVQPVGAWLETLCAYAGCQAINEAGVVTLIPNAPADVSATFTPSNIVAGSLRLRKNGTLDVPTAVRVRFTNTAQIPYQEDSAVAYSPGVLAGTVPRRESQVEMFGINRYSQALREAIEQLNGQTLSDLSANFVSFDESIKVRKGDVIEITHPVGAATNTLLAKKFRVGATADLGFGRYRISANEYDAAAYSNEVITVPSDPDTS